MISAALQRRVWVGPNEKPLFPNLYVILVGQPGIGKGLVIKSIHEFIKFNKAKSSKQDESTNNNEAVDLDYLITALHEVAGSKTKLNVDDPLMFPMAPESTTYESLVKTNAKAIRLVGPVEKTSLSPNGRYVHSSLCFVLEEMSSLFRKKTEAIVNYLICAFDGGDYTYETKTQGTDRVRRTCLNFLAGTTPRFMQETFDDRLLNEGFAARTIFAMEYANRSNKFGINPFNDLQLKCKAEILMHLRKLSSLFGHVEYTTQAWERLRHYFEDELPIYRVNNHPKLDAYYARKNIHVQKLALAIHFSDSIEMIINLEEVEKALKILSELEIRMHSALTFTGKNPLAQVSKDILRAIEKSSNGLTFVEIWVGFSGEIREQELQECIRYLIGTSQLTTEEIKIGNEKTMVYKKKH